VVVTVVLEVTLTVVVVVVLVVVVGFGVLDTLVLVVSTCLRVVGTVDIVVTTIADEVVVLNWGVMVCLRRFRFERLLCFTLFLLVDLRDDEMGTRFLNLFSALDDPIFRLLIAGHDATNVLVVVLAVVVEVVGANEDAVVVIGPIVSSLVFEINDS
jgi:hypothetical protein